MLAVNFSPRGSPTQPMDASVDPVGSLSAVVPPLDAPLLPAAPLPHEQPTSAPRPTAATHSDNLTNEAPSRARVCSAMGKPSLVARRPMKCSADSNRGLGGAWTFAGHVVARRALPRWP